MSDDRHRWEGLVGPRQLDQSYFTVATEYLLLRTDGVCGLQKREGRGGRDSIRRQRVSPKFPRPLPPTSRDGNGGELRTSRQWAPVETILEARHRTTSTLSLYQYDSHCSYLPHLVVSPPSHTFQSFSGFSRRSMVSFINTSIPPEREYRHSLF